MNPSGMGGFMEGIAGGISGGMENYAQLAIAKIDKDEKRALVQAEMAIKLFTDPNQPIAVKKMAYGTYKKIITDWNTGIPAMDIPDEAWESKTLAPYLKKLNNIAKNKELSNAQKNDSIKKLMIEATESLGYEKTEPLRKEAGQVRVRGLLEPTDKTPSLLMGGLTTAYGQPGAAGIKALTGTGMPIKEAAGVFPKITKKGAEGITPTYKESRLQHFIKNYGLTRDKFGQIIEILPKQRIHRLKGWLRTREFEEKKGVFTQIELNQTEQAIMTSLRVEPQIQDSINLIRDQGAKVSEIRILLDEYLKKTKWKSGLK